MDFGSELIKGEIVNCYKNLILDVKIKDEIVAAFCPELDAKQNIYQSGTEVWLQRVNKLKNRLKYEAVVIRKNGALVMINPLYVPILVEEAFERGKLREFSRYTKLRRIETGENIKYANLEFSNENEDLAYVYAVSIYNKQGANVVFPSFLNFFEMSMFGEFATLRKMGYETYVLLIVPRMDCQDIKFSWTIEPAAAARIFDEAKNWLKFCGYGCTIDDKSINITQSMNILY